jgi:hypothetical protein
MRVGARESADESRMVLKLVMTTATRMMIETDAGALHDAPCHFPDFF